MRINNRHKLGVALFLAAFFFGAGFSYALDLSIEPANAQRAVGGKIRVNIYATDAVDLISYGIKLTFNPAVLQAESAQKYFNSSTLEGWLMDADGFSTPGDQYTTPLPEINNTNGTVTMIGGRLTGASTTGLSGKVLLGYVVFYASANGNTNLALSVAKPPFFDNFVGLGGPPAPVYDDDIAPVNTPVNKGIICIAPEAIVGDINGNAAVDSGDFAMLRLAMGKSYPDANYNVLADFNANGSIDSGDFAILRANMGKATLTCSN